MIYLHDVAILALDLAPALSAKGLLASAWLADEPAIQDALNLVGHPIKPARLQQRLRNGLRLVRFDLDGTPVATTWLASSGGRYIDELNWLLPIGAGDVWLRDVFVAPAWRGRGLFSKIVATLAWPQDGPARRIWSDVDWVNAQSMRAHKAAGFQVVARVRALDFWGRLRVRSAVPPWPMPVSEIEPASRLIWLRGGRLRRHLELLA